MKANGSEHKNSTNGEPKGNVNNLGLQLVFPSIGDTACAVWLFTRYSRARFGPVC